MGFGRFGFIAAFVATVVEPRQANAFSGYRCIVKGSYELGVAEMTPHKFSKLYLGQEFVIDRANGQMLGAPGLSSVGWTGRNEVLDQGSHEQSYKVIYVSPAFVHVRFLLVREYDRGPVKSFMLVDDTTVLTGNCTHSN